MKLNLRSETAAAIVAGASFIASAGHIVTVVNESNPLPLSLVYPIGIDGLIYVGIRALQSKRPVAGSFALLIGGFYSLAFNAHAEGALTMSRLLIAASMPICMMVAFVIEATGRKAEEIAPEIREVIKETVKTVYPELLPIVPPAKRPVAAARTPRPKTVTAKADAPKTSGRVAAWDVEKAVRLLADGRTDADILAAVDGLTVKPWQRTKRAVRMINEGSPIAMIAEKAGVSVTHVQRIKEAM
jgi:hypothetical protein